MPGYNGGPPRVYPQLSKPRPKLWLHLLLFALTVASTWLFIGWQYSLCVMTILTFHEFGHFFAARHYRVPATLPYFIPFPSLFGTMGAVIRMSPFIPNRRALFDIAAAGPIAGLVVAIPVAVYGIVTANFVPAGTLGHEHFPMNAVDYSGSLFFRGLLLLVHGSSVNTLEVVPNEFAYAGWVGLFVTALNLLPISQLDGGHISYALFREKSRMVAMLAFGALIVSTLVLGFHYVLIILLMAYAGIRHPPTMDDSQDLDRTRWWLGIGLGIVFLLCFTPVPVEM
jgi:membrane-associated protease RseP (regulator of RpoE activity)